MFQTFIQVLLIYSLILEFEARVFTMTYVPNLSATYLIVCLLFWERNLLSCWLTQPGVILVIHLPQLPRVLRLQAWTTAPSVFISCSSFTIFLLLSFKRICVFWVRSSLTVDLQIFLIICHLIPLTMSFSETKKNGNVWCTFFSFLRDNIFLFCV